MTEEGAGVGPTMENTTAPTTGTAFASQSEPARLEKAREKKKVTDPKILKSVEKFLHGAGAAKYKIQDGMHDAFEKVHTAKEVEDMAREYLQKKAKKAKAEKSIFLLIFLLVFVLGSATLMCYLAMANLKQFHVQGGTPGEADQQPHATLTATDGNSILETHEATIDIDGSVLLQKKDGEYIVKDEDLEAVKTVAYMNDQTKQDDGHYYGTFSTYVVQGLARTSNYVSFITARGHEIRLVEQEEDGSMWEVLYIEPGLEPRYICEEEDEDDGKGRLLVTIRRKNLDKTMVDAYAVKYTNYF